jgi:hypothetical protein
MARAHVSQMSGAHVSRMARAHVSQMSGAHVSRLTGDHDIRMAEAHVSRMAEAYIKRRWNIFQYFLWISINVTHCQLSNGQTKMLVLIQKDVTINSGRFSYLLFEKFIYSVSCLLHHT